MASEIFKKMDSEAFEKAIKLLAGIEWHWDDSIRTDLVARYGLREVEEREHFICFDADIGTDLFLERYQGKYSGIHLYMDCEESSHREERIKADEESESYERYSQILYQYLELFTVRAEAMSAILGKPEFIGSSNDPGYPEDVYDTPIGIWRVHGTEFSLFLNSDSADTLISLDIFIGTR